MNLRFTRLVYLWLEATILRRHRKWRPQSSTSGTITRCVVTFRGTHSWPMGDGQISRGTWLDAVKGAVLVFLPRRVGLGDVADVFLISGRRPLEQRRMRQLWVIVRYIG